MGTLFNLVSPYQPAGDQPRAIEALLRGFNEGKAAQVLLGATGTGKTFTASHVIANLNRPTLVLAHNKTLAAQLYQEFKAFFPENAVNYFVSYYDYYQPEAYIPQRDIYIEKDAQINENIDRLRLAATSALVSRQDVIIVASVSCIYGLGSPSDYKRMVISLKRGESIRREELLLKLVDIQYKRNDISFTRGTFRVRGDVIEIWPASEEISLRVELFGDEIDNLSLTNPLTGEVLKTNDELFIYPAKHFVTPENRMKTAVEGIKKELDERLDVFKKEGKLLEAQRLAARTKFDIEMLMETGHCPGVENYARWFSGRNPGEPPYTLMDFFPEDFLLVVDESHVTVPQVRGMYAGDHSRKTTLVDHGFRLPSALDNRPFRFEEWENKSKRILFMSATPSEYELSRCKGEVVEQVIRPTGLVDPILHVRPAKGQVADLLKEIKIRVERKERVLVTTLTKRMAEDLTRFFQETGIRCKWLHSELDAIERIKVLRELREGAFDVLVGINLLREGLDLPEVSLVAVLDADKEGFLRSARSLTQIAGRAARNVNGRVVMYADKVTDSMKQTIEETARRREKQLKYNEENGITPASTSKSRESIMSGTGLARSHASLHKSKAYVENESFNLAADPVMQYMSKPDLEKSFNKTRKAMEAAAKELDFAEAARLRDEMYAIEKLMKSK